MGYTTNHGRDTGALSPEPDTPRAYRAQPLTGDLTRLTGTGTVDLTVDRGPGNTYSSLSYALGIPLHTDSLQQIDTLTLTKRSLYLARLWYN